MLKGAVVGVGSMGKNHARVLASLKNVELMGVCDTDKQRAQEVAQAYDCVPFYDFQELLEHDLDFLIIATPTTKHLLVAADAIEAGIHLLIEKPIADDVASAKKIQQKAKQKGVEVMVGHIERFNPAVLQLKEKIEEGKLGQILSLHATRIGPSSPRIRDVSLITDLGVHDIDIMTYLTGKKIKRVYATSEQINRKLNDHALIHLDFGGSLAGTVEVNWLTPFKIRELRVTGTEGIAYLNYLEQTLTIHQKDGSLDVKIECMEPLLNEIRHFINALTSAKKMRIPPTEGIAALKAAIAANQSITKQDFVVLD